jgi:hypothetical protein
VPPATRRCVARVNDAAEFLSLLHGTGQELTP